MSAADEPMDEPILPGDPRYDGFRVENVWLYLAVDPADAQEGVLISEDVVAWALRNRPAHEAPILPPGPMIATDQRRVDDLRDIVERYARAHGVEVRVARFGGREDEVLGG